ncbi:VWA domain-containing protein [candidate division KSB1 bacterium]
MFRFEHTIILYGLFLIPFFIVIFWMMKKWKARSLKAFGDTEVIDPLLPEASKVRPVFKFILLMLSYIFLVIGLANPQIGSKLEKVKRKGVDLMIALDISNSMNAEDIKPNRLERSKQAISRLIDGLTNDRIGIVVFAGKAYVQLPITTDYAAAKMFISTIKPNLIQEQGTAIGSAIELASQSFEDEDKKNKAIIIITDGENHEDDAINQTAKVSERGIFVNTIGMGLPDGAPIPVYNGSKLVGFKKDKSGNTVITKLDEVMLQQIASAGEGIYVRANNTKAGVEKVFKEINKMEKKEFDSRLYADYEDRFQYFIGFGLLLLILELLIYERKNKYLSRIKLFEKRLPFISGHNDEKNGKL